MTCIFVSRTLVVDYRVLSNNHFIIARTSRCHENRGPELGNIDKAMIDQSKKGTNSGDIL